MKHESLRTFVWGPIFALLLATVLALPGAAQEPPKKPAVQPPAKPAVTKQETNKPKGRLPAYFGKVVSQKQREEIYAIQAKYNEEIDKLKEQLEELTTKRDTEVEQVLTDEQRTEIAQMKNARRSRSSSKSSGDGTSSDQ